MRASREGEDTTSLRATVDIDGEVGKGLEPGVRDLHWHIEEGEEGRPALA